MSAAEADRWAWLLVLSFVFGCNVLRILLPSFSSFVSAAWPSRGRRVAALSPGVGTGVSNWPREGRVRPPEGSWLGCFLF